MHINAGAAALAVAIVLGKGASWGKLRKPHNVPLTLLGAGLLWAGWYAFNGGSALAAGNSAAIVMVTTFVATCAATLAWLAVEKIKDGHVTGVGAAAGAITGLVAITPACGSVTPVGAIVLGLVAGAICPYAVGLKSKFGYDDSLDVVGVHLVGGVIGTLLIGFLASDTMPNKVNGLFYGGGFDQLWRQAVAAGAVMVYSFVDCLRHRLGHQEDDGHPHLLRGRGEGYRRPRAPRLGVRARVRLTGPEPGVALLPTPGSTQSSSCRSSRKSLLENMSATLAELAEKSATKFILALFVDLRGKPCAKLVPVEAVDLLATEGVGFAGYAVGAMGQEPKDPDLMAIPDPASFTPVPFIKEGLAIVHCDPHVEGQPWPYAPRVILKSLIQRAADAGFEPWVGAEVEYFLLTRAADGSLATADTADTAAQPCYDARGVTRMYDHLTAISTAMNTLGWSNYANDHEDGNGQFEQNFQFADALTTADRVITLRYLLSMIAAERGMIATFMPKPFADRTGSGLHLHLSLTSGGTPVFPEDSDDRGLGLSPTAYAFIGGILDHACALQAVVGPTVNSYKRTGATHHSLGSVLGADSCRPTAATTAPTTSASRIPNASSCAAATDRPTRTWPSPPRWARASTASSAASTPVRSAAPTAAPRCRPPCCTPSTSSRATR